MAKACPLLHTWSRSGFCIQPPGARANAVRMYFKRAALGRGSTVARAINCVRPLYGRRSGTISGYFWASCAGHAAYWAQVQAGHPLGRSSCAKEARGTADRSTCARSAARYARLRQQFHSCSSVTRQAASPAEVRAHGKLGRSVQRTIVCRRTLEVRGQLNRCHVNAGQVDGSRSDVRGDVVSAICHRAAILAKPSTNKARLWLALHRLTLS